MALADWIFLGAVIVAGALGAVIGLGRGIKCLVSGKIMGTVISVVLCYMFGGMIMDIPFVSTLLKDFANLWAGSWFTHVHFEIVVYYIALFIIFCLVRVLLVAVISRGFESDLLVIKILNKVGGFILFTALGILIMLFVFQIITWIGGNTAQNMLNSLAGSSIVKPMFVNNPLSKIVELVKG